METTKNSNLPEDQRAGFFRSIADYWWGGFTKVAVTRYDIQTPKIAEGADLRIAFVSDIHADTKFMPAKRIKDVVATTNALGADLIVLGGDYSTQDNWRMTSLPLAETASFLADLSAPLGVVAILGNHDWWDDRSTQTGQNTIPETVQVFRDAGIEVMLNDARCLDHTSGIQIAGLNSQMAFERPIKPHGGAHDVDKATATMTPETFNVLLAHEPDIFAELADDVAIDLVISGHTHGGQIKIFGKRPIVPSAYGARYAYGHLNERGRDLIVSGGIGCSSIPVRFGVVPEIVLVNVKGKAPATS